MKISHRLIDTELIDYFDYQMLLVINSKSIEENSKKLFISNRSPSVVIHFYNWKQIRNQYTLRPLFIPSIKVLLAFFSPDFKTRY